MTVSSAYRFAVVVVVAAGLLAAASTVVALQVNNNASATLTVRVQCAGKENDFNIGPNQVGNCFSNIWVIHTRCSYHMKAHGGGSCAGKIDGSAGLEVSASGSGLSYMPY